MIKTLSKKAGFVLAVVGAAVIGGAATAVVQAAIPSSTDGQIHGCYRNSAGLFDSKGTLRVVDSDASQSCTNQETALNWDTAGAANNYGYITTMQDPNNPTGKHILDPAHSKNVNKFKVVLCDDPDLTPAGVESCAYRPGESLATCIDLAFIPRYSEPQYSTTIADSPDGSATINSWCGPGYNMAGFEQRDARFVFFK